MCMKIFTAGDNDVGRTRIDPKTGVKFSPSCSWHEGVPPGTEHLRTAVIEGGAQRETMEVLWGAKEHRMDVLDDGISKWIRERGDGREQWLAKQMGKWNLKHPPNVLCECEECKTDDCRRMPGLRNSRLRSEEGE